MSDRETKPGFENVASGWKDKNTVVSIDFGTSFTGCAISFRRDHGLVAGGQEKLRLLAPVWRCGSLTTVKTPTVLLLKPDKSFHSFGYVAQDKYARLSEKREDKDWYYFHSFKMKLYGDKKTKPIHLDSVIPDAHGREVKAIHVFAHAIDFMKDHITKILKEKLSPEFYNDIYFVLTCPAIWPEHSKQFMRMAAKHAHIPDDHLQIALEPECAALFIREEEIPDRAPAMLPGLRYLVVDMGGGTLDIAAHEINSENKIEEILSPDGGPFGGSNINLKFEQFLVSVSGAEAVMQFKEKFMEDFLLLMRTFEQKKCSFEGDEEGSVRLHIPSSFVDVHADCNGENLQKSLSQCNLSKSVRKLGDKLDFDQETFHMFFEETVNNIIEKIGDVLKTTGKQVSMIYCVGGFSECQIVKRRLTEVFGCDHQIKFPAEGVAAIMKGAVILARDQNIIKSRVSKYTIGLDWNVPFDPTKHDTSKRECVDDGFVCSDIFRTIVKKGDPIPTGRPVHVVKSYVKTATQDKMEFPFYRSDISDNPQYIDDVGCHLMGTMTVPFEDTSDGLDRSILLSVYIDQILRAEAVDENGQRHTVTYNMDETVV